MSYELILFDADDTLFDYSQSETYALNNAFRDHEVDFNMNFVESYRTINQQLWTEYENGNITLELLRFERFRRFFSEHRLDINVANFSDRYTKYLGEGSFLVNGAVNLCNYLLKHEYRIAIITNGIKEVQLGRISRSELSNSFEQIIVSEDAGYQKPHKGIFDYAFNKLNILNKERVIIVGDSLSSDIQGGINYGIDTCWFNPKRKTNDSDIKPKYEINDLADLPRIL